MTFTCLLYNGELISGVMIHEGNRQKRQSYSALPLERENLEPVYCLPFISRFPKV